MKLITQTPKQSLNKAFLKQPVNRDEIDTFKNNLQTLLGKINESESEEHHKYPVRDFLKDTFYKTDYEMNTKGRQDLVIHTGKLTSDPVGVILEAKKPNKPAEMITADNPNKKALQELVLYFLRERIDEKNNDVKYLIVTNINEWFVFEASIFNRLFFENKAFVKEYKDWRDKLKITSNTPLFYNEIVKPYIESIDEIIPCTYFDIRDYETALKNDDDKNDESLIELFKILSPTHLLKLPFADDSNKLDKNFYTELLHIIGLEEIKDKSKLRIDRKAEGRRDAGSLIENAITIIKTEDLLPNVANIEIYGETREERIFNIALDLCLTWINRVLFLKLLEAQLVDYHNGNQEFRFLDAETIKDFDGLYRLFHQVLAINFDERISQVKEKFRRVPYLNSSLFEFTDLEKQTLKINSLNDTESLNLLNTTVLKEIKSQRGELPTLEYLFKFLDAYDFASEGREGIKENKRDLINASVLGKVFEKINGYKDGSIYTPGFITMYMCRQAIRLAVVQKFKDKYELDIDKFEDLENYVGRFYKTADVLEFNALVNSLHLCDPAVGSGHFLVSSLNEIIAIKSELKILADENGKTFPAVKITVENDELVVFDEQQDQFFKYQIKDGKPATGEAQRLQKTLFHEKQTLIENCLFGVDINPNSVKICRLRLWIELLKNAYYKESANFVELETLPNIDINIKEGNSLLSRFALDADLKEVLKNKKNIIAEYRNAVSKYKNEKNRDQKRELLGIIEEIKGEFTTEIYKHDPKMVDLAKKERRLFEINSPSLFEKYSDGEREVLSRNLEKHIGVLNKEIADIKSNAIYKNAFEWRFEFPEVLDNEGNFIGFDIVIGNPPYGFRNILTPEEKIYFRKVKNYEFSSGDSAELFIKVCFNLLIKDKTILSFIIPKKSLYGDAWEDVRVNYWKKYELISLLDAGKSFEGILLEAAAFCLRKTENNNRNVELAFLDTKKASIFSEVPFEKIFVKSNTCQIYKVLYPESIFDKIQKLSFDESVLKGNLGLAIGTNFFSDEPTNYKLLKGIDIERYLVRSNRYLKNEENLNWNNAKEFLKPKVITQVIVAHIENPFPHLKITACFDEEGIIITNTLMAFNLSEKINPKFWLAYLNTKFLSWYAYNFIYSGAIRTMHFYDFYIQQIPIPKIEEKDQQPFVALVDQILELKKAGEDTQELENEIDRRVYRLYDLTDDEIAIVEGEEK